MKIQVGVTGIEPAHLTVLDPKSSASASSATLPRTIGSISSGQELSSGNWDRFWRMRQTQAGSLGKRKLEAYATLCGNTVQSFELDQLWEITGSELR